MSRSFFRGFGPAWYRSFGWSGRVLSAAFCLTASLAAAPLVVVDSLQDAADTNGDTLPDGLDGVVSAGQLTLREALTLVDPSGVIQFAENLGGGTIELTPADSGDTVFALGSKAITLEGPANPITLLAQTNELEGRRFRLFSTAADLTLRRLHLTGGLLAGGAGGAVLATQPVALVCENVTFSANSAPAGGALALLTGGDGSGSLLLRASSFLHNSATETAGGAISAANTTVSVENTRFDSNTAVTAGGALALTGDPALHTADILASTFRANSVTGPGSGGALSFVGVNANLRRSTFAGNQALNSGTGGALYFEDGALLLENCTVSGNRAFTHSIAFFASTSGDSLTLRHSTFIANRSDTFINTGEGDFQVSNPATPALRVDNCLFAANSFSVNTFIADTNFSALAPGAGNYLQSSAPGGNLATLESLGIEATLRGSGFDNLPPETHALRAGSPLLDAGSNAVLPPSLTVDQRGQARLAGTAVDIGAFELQSASPVVTLAGDSPTFTTPAAFFDVSVQIADDETAAPNLAFRLTSSNPAFPATLETAANRIRLDNPQNLFQGTSEIELLADDGDGNVTRLAFTFTLTPLLLTVDSLADIEDTNGDGIPDGLDNDVGPGQFTLREALARIADGGTVRFAPGLAGGTIQVETLAAGNTAFTFPAGRAVTVEAPSGGITLSTTANPFSGRETRFFQTESDLTLRNLIFRNAYVENENGAVVLVPATAPAGLTLLLDRCILRNNSIFGGNAAGLGFYAGNGIILIRETDFRDNIADRNVALQNTNQGHSPALQIGGTGNQVTLLNSSFSGHRADLNASVLEILDASLITLRNTTFFNNRGGAKTATLGAPGQAIEITNCTFAANGNLSFDDTVWVLDGVDLITIQNSAFIENKGDDIAFQDPTDPLLTQVRRNNWIQDELNPAGTLTITQLGLSNTLFPADPVLGQTGALRLTNPASPLIDTGNDAAAAVAGVFADQHRLPLWDAPVGGPSTIDIGAMEYQGAPPVIAGDVPLETLFSPLTGGSASFAFTLTDDRSAPANLLVTVTSSNGDVVAPSGLAWAVTGNTLNLTVTPVPGAFEGTTNLTVSVDDGLNGLATRSFAFTLNTSEIVVDTTEDINDGNYAPGDVSLREAISLISPGGAIRFSPALAGQTLILAPTAPHNGLRLTKNMTIDGQDRGITLSTLSNPANQPFVSESASPSPGPFLRHFLLDLSGTVTIRNLTLANGAALYPEGTHGLNGGSILITRGNLNLVNVIFRQNRAGRGGAIFQDSTTSTLDLNRCQFIDNQALVPAAGATVEGRGGALYTRGNLDVLYSTFSANRGGEEGGVLFAPGGQVEIRNSTLSGNTSRRGAAALQFAFADFTHVLTLQQCTVVFNTSDEDFLGRGAVNLTNNSPVVPYLEITNSLFFGNSAGSPAVFRDLNVPGTLSPVAEGNFLHSNQPNPASLHPLAAGLIPQLALNGAVPGSPQTHAIFPLTGSLLIDRGRNDRVPLAVADDQRGQPRALDLPAFGAADAVDVGAFEAQNDGPGLAAQLQVTAHPLLPPEPLLIPVSPQSGRPPVIAGLSYPADVLQNLTAELVTAEGSTTLVLTPYPQPNTFSASTQAIIALGDGAGGLSALVLNLQFLVDALTVDLALDEDDNNFSPGDLSLREALRAIGDGGVIDFAPALAGQTLLLTQGELRHTGGKTLTLETVLPGLTLEGIRDHRILQTDGHLSLRGLTFQKGDPDGPGGAVLVTGGKNLTVANCLFRQNTAGDGGALALTGSGGVLSLGGSHFQDNVATEGISGSGSGGAFHLPATASTQILGCTFSGNSASGLGGAGFIAGGSLQIRNSTFSGNQGGQGAALHANGTGLAFVHNTVAFHGDRSPALFLGPALAQATLQNSLFLENAGGDRSSAGGFAGDLLDQGNFIPERDQPGANAQNSGLDPVLRLNATQAGIAPTHALLPGSPLRNTALPAAVPEDLLFDQRGLSRVAFSGPDFGAFEYQSDPPVLTGTLDSPVFDSMDTAYDLLFRLSDDQTALGDLTVLVTSSDPRIFLSSVAPTADGLNLRLSREPGFLRGQTTLNLEVIDSGGGRSTASFLLPVEPSRLLVDAPADLADGNYAPGQLSLREAISLIGAEGLIEFAPALSASPLLLQNTLNLAGDFTLEGGSAGVSLRPDPASPNLPFRHFLLSGNLTLRNLTLEDGSTLNLTEGRVEGGALLVTSGDILLERVTLRGNASGGSGGAIALDAGSLTLRDCWLDANAAAQNGGALFLSSGSAQLLRTTLSANTAVRGGAIFASDLTTLLSLRNSTVAGNQAGEFSALFLGAGDLEISQSTFVLNRGSVLTPADGQVHVADLGDFSRLVQNSLFAHNRVYQGNTPVAERDLNFHGQFQGSNNFFLSQQVDPLSATPASIGFRDTLAANGNGPRLPWTHALLPGSPLINAGGTLAAAPFPTDQRGFTRIVNGLPDLGAYEFQNLRPIQPQPLPSLVFAEDAGPQSVSLLGVFASPAGDDEPSFSLQLQVTSGSSLFSQVPNLVDSGHGQYFLQFQSAPDLFGQAALLLTATDTAGAGSVSLNGLITINPVADAPRLLRPLPDSSVRATRTSNLNLAEFFFDPDPGPLLFQAQVAHPLLASALPSSSQLTLSGLLEGQTTVTLTASQADGLSTSDSFQLNILPPNLPPQLAADRPTRVILAAGTTQRVLPLSDFFRDDPGDILQYTVLSIHNSHLGTAFVNNLTGTLTFNRLGADGGLVTVLVRATDSSGESTETSIPILIDADSIWRAGLVPNSNWRADKRFGLFTTDSMPWIYHAELGWIYVVPMGHETFWMFLPDLGWCYVGFDFFPYLYRRSDAAFLYFYRNVTPRTFYNFSTGLFEIFE